MICYAVLVDNMALNSQGWVQLGYCLRGPSKWSGGYMDFN
jgi:hypothetical protein